MYRRGVLLFFCVFLGQHTCSQPDENSNELNGAEWQCNTVCVGSGGKAEFDVKNKVCKCMVDKNIDEIDLDLFIKNAKAVGFQLENIEVDEKEIVKREIDRSMQDQYMMGPQYIVGQRSPQRTATRPTIRSTTRRPSIRPTTRRAPIQWTTARRTINAQQRLQQVQNRINELRRGRTTRNRSGPHLQQRAGFADESKPNLLEVLKDRQKEIQEKRKNKTSTSTTTAPNVAAPEPKPGTDNVPTPSASSGAQSGQNTARTSGGKSARQESSTTGRKSRFEVVTQDPSLYKKEE